MTPWVQSGTRKLRRHQEAATPSAIVKLQISGGVVSGGLFAGSDRTITETRLSDKWRRF